MTQRRRNTIDVLAPGDSPGANVFISRRRWLAAVGASACTSLVGCEKASPPAQLATSARPRPPAAFADRFCHLAPDDPPLLDHALRELWSHQADDGAWRSTAYAQLRSGQALTPFVYDALCRGNGAILIVPPPYEMKALDFVRRSVNINGVVGANDPELPEYPNYATSLALQCLIAAKDAQDRPLIERMTAYLVGQQYCEATGFGPEHPAYGGWGFGGARPVGNSPGHMDIGHTRHVLQALRAAGHDDPTTYARAEQFLRLLQKHPTEDRPQPSSQRAGSVSDRSKTVPIPYDGGFYFSPIVHAANKGGEPKDEAGRPYFGSYATATCDGILSLLACGVPRDDERIQTATKWLQKNPRLDYPEGVLDGTDTNWGASIRFYHFAVRAECYAALAWPGEWRRELRDILAQLQQPDGSFVNREGFLMKEDDPLLCTALAIIALSKFTF